LATFPRLSNWPYSFCNYQNINNSLGGLSNLFRNIQGVVMLDGIPVLQAFKDTHRTGKLPELV